MTKLTDTQAILLSNAAQREDGSMLPLPASLIAGPHIDKAIAALLRRDLIGVRLPLQNQESEEHGEPAPPAYVITSAGLAAIGVEDADASPAPPATAPASEESPISTAPKTSKIALVLGLLEREDGVGLGELIAATGWLPHTARAALTGLRRKGHVIDRTGRGESACYRVAR